MGWSYGIVEGKAVGYSVEAICEHPNCNKRINRGLAYKCGNDIGSGEDFCNGFFCSDHLFLTVKGWRCAECSDLIEDEENEEEEYEERPKLLSYKESCTKKP